MEIFEEPKPAAVRFGALLVYYPLVVLYLLGLYYMFRNPAPFSFKLALWAYLPVLVIGLLLIVGLIMAHPGLLNGLTIGQKPEANPEQVAARQRLHARNPLLRREAQQMRFGLPCAGTNHILRRAA